MSHGHPQQIPAPRTKWANSPTDDYSRPTVPSPPFADTIPDKFQRSLTMSSASEIPGPVAPASGKMPTLDPPTLARLRAIADSFMRRERIGHTLQPTALVNEAVLVLMERRDLGHVSQGEYIQIAVQAMRRILIDYARAKKAKIRGGNMRRVTLDSAVLDGRSDEAMGDILEIEEALTRLEALNPRQAEVVGLRFYGGLPMDQIAEVLGISKRSAESAWTCSRAWLQRELDG